VVFENTSCQQEKQIRPHICLQGVCYQLIGCHPQTYGTNLCHKPLGAHKVIIETKRTHPYVRTHVRACVYTYVRTYLRMHVRLHASAHARARTHTHTHTHTLTNAQTHTQTHTNTQTNKEIVLFKRSGPNPLTSLVSKCLNPFTSKSQIAKF